MPDVHVPHHVTSPARARGTASAHASIIGASHIMRFATHHTLCHINQNKSVRPCSCLHAARTQAVHERCLPLSDEQIAQLFAINDVDANGTLSLDELEKLLQQLEASATHPKKSRALPPPSHSMFM